MKPIIVEVKDRGERFGDTAEQLNRSFSEQLKGDERGAGVAGQPENRFAIVDSESCGLPRLDSHALEMELG